MQISLTVNDRPYDLAAQPSDRLSDVLRRDLGLTATKVGCNAGDCGACTVVVDGEIVCACLMAIAQADGSKVETAEGLQRDGALSQLQKSFLHHGAAQCGICTPGMLIASKALLDRNPQPSREDVEDALSGVLCRCTGYRKIVEAVLNADGFNEAGLEPEAGDNVGAPICHLDGEAKVSGLLKYGNDVCPENALAVRVIRSPYHFARFTFGDRQKFLSEHPGIELVLDASDVPGENRHGVIPPFADQPVFAEETARYRGEAIAAVVGEQDAVEDLRDEDFPVVWEEIPFALTPSEATAEPMADLHLDRQGNLLIHGHVERGEVSAALDGSAHQVEVTSSTPFIEHAYIEPEAGYCVRNGDRLEIFGCTQAAQMDREALAAILGLDGSAVRIMPSACGGGFGSKLDVSFQPYVALAAWRLHRPATICYSRGESMRATTKRHPSEITLRIGCDQDGLITGFDFAGTFNTGAYASWGPTVANRVPVHASGPYFVPAYRAKSTAVHTNTPPSGAFRGFGVPQSAIAQEIAFDQLADLAGIDRLEFRLQNALQNGQPTVTGQVMEKGVGIAECLKRLQTTWDLSRERSEQFNASAQNTSHRKGVGLGTCWYGCGNTSLPNPSTVRMGVTAEGRIVLHQGAMDIGQGANTVIAQIAADALGVPVHAMDLIDGDTDLTPDCGKTSASRQTYVTGAAAKLSGEALRRQILRQVNVGHNATIIPEGGGLRLADGDQLSAIDLSALPENEFGYVFMAEETYDPPTSPLDANGQGVPYAVYGYGAQLIELTVDVTLGTVKLDRITTAHDVGRAINPMLIEGQIEGGVAQGIGMALMEDYVPGRTENLHDYLIPTIGDMPEFEHFIVEVEDAEGPYGAKGLGEHVLIPTAPAIVNAIRDATGCVVSDLPATPDKVLRAIRAGRQEIHNG